MSKIEKTIARQKQKIEEGQYYEAHQTILSLSRRYLKSHDVPSALSVLNSGALLLFNAGQGGSGADLARNVVEICNREEVKVDAEAKGRFVGLLRAWPRTGEDLSSRRRFAGDVIGWSAKYGEFPAGDPELHHVAGQLFAEDGEVYDAERHLALGTKDSAQILANLEYDWYSQDEAHTAALYAARAIFPLLLAGNLRAANQSLLLFTTKLSKSHSNLGVQEVSSSSSDIRVYPSLPLLNFLSLLLLAVQRGSADLFKNLRSHYDAHIREVGSWNESLDQVAESYFGIRKPKQSNPLMDMMGSMFGGGGGGGAAPSKLSKRGVAAGAPPPPAVD